MRSNSKQVGQSKPSFIEEARRSQIVETAIQTIAKRGYSGTSLAEIARSAGISKGVISYHFESKSALIEQILSRLLREPAEFIKARVDACGTALEKLRAYVTANFEFMRSHRNYYVALVDLWGSRDSGEGLSHFDAEVYEPSRRYLSKILEAGQKDGQLRLLPRKTTASVIQAAVDGVMMQWVFDPNAVDLDECAEEIMQMIGFHVQGVEP